MTEHDYQAHHTASVAHPTLRLCVGPVTTDEAALWQGLLGRLPAVAAVRVQGVEATAVHFLLHVPSISRLHAQLSRLSAKMDAVFEPSETGELTITLRPAAPARPRSAWSRAMTDRAHAWQGTASRP